MKDSTNYHDLSNNINYFELTNIKLLFFDIFYKNDKIYLVMPIYNKQADHEQIFIKVDDNRLKMSYSYVKDNNEPTLIYVYDYIMHKDTSNTIVVDVECNNIKKSYLLHHIRTTDDQPKKFLTLTTLFKNDYKLFTLFYNYYKNQGVSHFYMYYNGILTKEIKYIFIKYEDVTLVEWKFNYWNPNMYKYCHHAQMGQIHHAIYRYGKDMCDYMIFCDLDEYLHIPESKFEKNEKNDNNYNVNLTLKKFIENNPLIEIFGFCNIWANTIDDKYPTSHTLPDKIVINNQIDSYSTRSKNIYKISSIETVGIHSIGENITDCYKNITDLSMYHFYNWSRQYRTLENVNTEITLNKNMFPQDNTIITNNTITKKKNKKKKNKK
jgi:hypothetical protein